MTDPMDTEDLRYSDRDMAMSTLVTLCQRTEAIMGKTILTVSSLAMEAIWGL
jgi:hypothetical protein